MNHLINSIIHYSIQNKIVTPEKEAWFRFGLEKRLSTLIVFVPCAFLGIHLSGFWTAFFFLFSFNFTRSKVNGYHAKSVGRCLFGSIMLEYILLTIVSPQLSELHIYIVMVVSTVIVYIGAPFKHPNVGLTQKEYIACKKIARKRMLLLSVLSLFFCQFGLLNCAQGVASGSAMTSFLLCIAYISEWRIQKWKKFSVQ